MAAGALYAAVGIADLLAPRPHWPRPILLASFSDYLVQFFLIAALLGTLVAIVGLYAARRRNYGWVWAVGSFAAFFGHALLLYDASETAARKVAPASGSGAVDWGSLLALVGLVLLGTATLGARALPRWCGLPLLLSGFPFWVLPEDPSWWGGWLLLAGAWASLGFALFSSVGAAGRTTRAGRAPKNSPRRLRRGAVPLTGAEERLRHGPVGGSRRARGPRP